MVVAADMTIDGTVCALLAIANPTASKTPSNVLFIIRFIVQSILNISSLLNAAFAAYRLCSLFIGVPA
jgi:hypothetical protein